MKAEKVGRRLSALLRALRRAGRVRNAAVGIDKTFDRVRALDKRWLKLNDACQRTAVVAWNLKRL